MPADAKQVLEALGTALDGIAGIHGHAYTPDTIQTDAAIVTELDVRFDATMQRGADDMTATVRLLTAGDFRSAQQRLFTLVATVRDGLDGDLGGVVHYARVSRIRGDSWGQITVGEQTFAVVDFEVEIVA